VVAAGDGRLSEMGVLINQADTCLSPGGRGRAGEAGSEAGREARARMRPRSRRLQLSPAKSVVLRTTTGWGKGREKHPLAPAGSVPPAPEGLHAHSRGDQYLHP